MTKILDEVLSANAKYAGNFGDQGNLPLPKLKQARTPFRVHCSQGPRVARSRPLYSALCDERASPLEGAKTGSA